MKFRPSEFSDPSNYGWASVYPMNKLTVSQTAARLGLPNVPATADHERNLSRLSDFLAKIPFDLTVTSGYRAPNVNAAVGGAQTSQHMNGLAADIVPLKMTNRELAQWFYEYRSDFPELDQVIWYHDTNHVHVGICPSGATGCVGRAPRGEFLSAQKEGSSYYPWAPTAAEQAKMAALFAANRPLTTAFGVWLAAITVSSVVGLAVVWVLTRPKK